MQIIRQTAAGLLAVLSLWLLWQGLEGVLVLLSRGSPLTDALLSPPTSLWRILAAGLAVAGGIMGLLGLKRDFWVAGAGAILFTALGLMLAAMGTAMSLWLDEILAGLVMAALTAILVFVKRG